MGKKLHIIIILAALLVASCLQFNQSKNLSPSINNRSVANSAIDQIIDEFKTHFESDLSAARKGEVKTVQENLLKYLIEATNSKDSYKIKMYNDASEYFNRIYPVLLSNIQNEKNGVNKFKAIKSAPIWTLRDELNFLNKEATLLPPPKIRIDLLQGLKLITPAYKNIGDKNKGAIVDGYNHTATKILGSDFNLQPNFDEIENLILFEGDDEERILKFVAMVEAKLKKHEQSIRHIGTEISKSGQVDLKNTQIRLVVKFMDYYFSKLPDDVIKTILSELVTAGPKLTEETITNIVFQNTGPGLGKVLQQIGKEKGVGDKFSKLMGILESSGKQVPLHLVQEVVDSDQGGFEVKKISEKPLGTGTIAQVNKAVLVHEDVEREVALRFLKPGVAARCKEDITILRNFVPDNEEVLKKEGFKDIKVLGTLIDSVEKFLDDEVDLEIAVARQLKAHEVYTRSIKIKTDSKFKMLEMKVPEVYVPLKGKSNLHIQEFASGGVKFAELTDVNAQKAVAEEMLRMWFEEALFRSGFLNADLHQGNFRVVLVEESNKIKILLYDFGLSSTLSKEDQRAFILVGAGAFLKSPTTITDGLMVSMNSNDPAMRSKLMNGISAEMKIRPNKRAEDWVAWCVQKNYFVSDKLGAFARGSLLLKQLPESMGNTAMFKDIVVKSAVKNLAHSIADRDYNYPLTKMDLIKLSAVQIKNSCMDLFRSLISK